MFIIVQEDKREFDEYYNGPNYHDAIYEILTELRHKKKYTQERGSWEEAYSLINRILTERGVDL